MRGGCRSGLVDGLRGLEPTVAAGVAQGLRVRCGCSVARCCTGLEALNFDQNCRAELEGRWMWSVLQPRLRALDSGGTNLRVAV